MGVVPDVKFRVSIVYRLSEHCQHLVNFPHRPQHLLVAIFHGQCEEHAGLVVVEEHLVGGVNHSGEPELTQPSVREFKQHSSSDL